MHQLILELAAFERASEQVTTTPDNLLEVLFGAHAYCHCWVFEQHQQLNGLALVYPKYSTWKGTSLFLEDFIVRESKRQQGIGKLLFQTVVEFAQATGCARLEWQVLHWNEPALSFYRSQQAELNDEWLNGRISFPKNEGGLSVTDKLFL